MTQIIVLIVAFLMVAIATIKSFCKNVYNQATYKAAELSKKQGGKKND